MQKLPHSLQNALHQWREEDRLRRLVPTSTDLIDFCSNDYLGLAGQGTILDLPLGSGGSRLLSGNHPIHEDFERWAAGFFQGESSLLFSSGYLANLGVLSCLPQRGDTVLYDERCHASLKDGIRLSMAKKYPFLHNDLYDLRKKGERATGEVYVVVESMYSMDGDRAPLADLVKLCEEKGFWLILDEAHTTGIEGVGGRGMAQAAQVLDKVWLRIHTYGKAPGMSGASVVCTAACREYLVNRSRPFIYTTAPGPAWVDALWQRLREVEAREDLREKLWDLCRVFIQEGRKRGFLKGFEGEGPIIPLVIPGVDRVKKAARDLQNKGFDLRPILAPTVREGEERLRIVVHAFNKPEEILAFWEAVGEIL